MSLPFRDSGGALVLERVLPDGIVIRPSPTGMGLFATTSFPKGGTLFEAGWVVIPDEPGTAVLRTQHGDVPLDLLVHSVPVVGSDPPTRQLYSFDAFCNHSCRPNSFSATPDDHSGKYRQVATRDVHPGDEITCDYDLFEYDSSDEMIERCGCGSAGCRVQVRGFRFLPRSQQLKLIRFCYPNAVQAPWSAANPGFVIPSCVGMMPDDSVYE